MGPATGGKQHTRGNGRAGRRQAWRILRETLGGYVRLLHGKSVRFHPTAVVIAQRSLKGPEPSPPVV